jgi:phenylpropionate dioxygenase-like ring-hydroxylating dioxygenase large terminal subunit
MRDICPHRAAPLSAGRLVASPTGPTRVECPYHGWRFRTDGVCAADPVAGRRPAIDISASACAAIRPPRARGWSWIWVSSDPRFSGEPPEPPPTFEGVVGGRPKLVDHMDFDAHIDHAVRRPDGPGPRPLRPSAMVVALQASQHEKAKVFEPREAGFAMVRHEPSKNSRPTPSWAASR